MRIGITRSAANSASGGTLQYEIVLLKALSEIAPRSPEQFVYLTYQANDLATLASAGGLEYRGLPVISLSKQSAQQAPPAAYTSQRPVTPPASDPKLVRFDPAAEELLRSTGIGLLLPLSPSLPAFAFRLPFVTPIFDLNHKLQPEFPEVSAFGETDRREYFYINTCKFATLVLVDSEKGRDDVLACYGDYIDSDRIRILPYYPPVEARAAPDQETLARVRAKYNLPPRYFFYPAQFWSHKNHAAIVRAIKLIAEETGDVVHVVFCGAYSDYVRALNFNEVMALGAGLSIADRIHYLGLVPDEDMAALYVLSLGLVMPTFFGPTNIPPLEAWHFDRPVIASDIAGHREQIGDAGLLADPRSPQALAEAMKRLWHDEGFRTELAARGRKRLASYSWSSYVNAVANIVTEACERVKSGRTPRYPELEPAPTAARRA
jgi:glycosyltransferase involved in cell wall biosynthesis